MHGSKNSSRTDFTDIASKTGTQHQARRNIFVSGGYKFVRTLYNLVVKVVCLKF